MVCWPTIDLGGKSSAAQLLYNAWLKEALIAFVYANQPLICSFKYPVVLFPIDSFLHLFLPPPPKGNGRYKQDVTVS